MFSTPLSIEILAPAESGEPFQRNAASLAPDQTRDNAPAFGFGNRTEVPARIAHQNDTRHALGVFAREVADDADNDVGLVLPIRAIDRNQAAVGIEIVLHEVAGGKLGRLSRPEGASAF